ncbi:MAG: dockerin type I domain-containing protein [Pirellula sp.]
MKKASNRRSLRIESLESRHLFAIDGLVPHNFLSPEDCDNSGDVSPLDALVVINELNRTDSSPMLDTTKMLDVDADGSLSPLDALIVINHLNFELKAGEAMPSSVSKESRILRLQAAIADGDLPPSMGLDDAREVLATLESGGKPELGERFIDGHLCDKTEVEKIETERTANSLTKPIHENDPPDRLEHFVEKFSARLKAAGVDGQVIGTIASEIASGIESKKPLKLDQIKTRLTELGVDVSKLFPEKQLPVPPTDPAPQPNPHEHRIAEWVERLKNAGIRGEVITTVVGEIKTSIAAGTPLTADQIRVRLVALGVDVSKLFPTVSPEPGHEHPAQPIRLPSVELVTSILKRLNVSGDTIDVVRKAMLAAKESGKPLSVSSVLALLTENGVRIPEYLTRLIGLA